MDDCIAGEDAEEKLLKRQDELQMIISTGGFLLKGFTVSGEDPEEALSKDGVSISVARSKWFSQQDSIAPDIKELNFAKKRRGRKTEVINEVPDDLKRKDCASKYGEIFDLTGLLAPLMAGMKEDLHELTARKLHWDDVLPNNLQAIWKSHFEMISEMKNIRFKRAVVPHDAVDLNITTLDFGDASESLSCVDIYVRFKRRSGAYSCQLVFAKSKLIPDNTTQPRGELLAALNNTHAGEVVRRALSSYHQRSFKFTDSQIVLFWICNNAHVLKQWTRNRVIEILRFTIPADWWFVDSENMIADLGTRRCSDIRLVGPDSDWINGYGWMTKDESEFPKKSASDIILSNQETQNMKKEMQDTSYTPEYPISVHHTSEHILERYLSSDYIVDPNRWKFSTVIRVVALVKRFVKNLRNAVEVRRETNSRCKKVEERKLNENELKNLAAGNFISDEEINTAKEYYYQKATQEIKTFLKPSKYKDISTEVNGVLKFSGRILPTDDITIVGRATQVMKDLSATTFAVPLVDKDSPIAYSIINDTHWYHPTVLHRGVDITWRYVLKEAYIIDGRPLVCKIKNSCERCRFLNKKNLEVSMGPVSPHTLTIAPAFYATQLDVAGPLLAYCHHHKRSTIKIWLIVYCCSTTSMTSIKVMDDYSTTAFIQAFVRFSSEVGYPKTMLCDAGSQLVKGCGSMKLTFRDLQHQLHRDAAVELNVCPVGGHNMNGRVERKIQEVRKSISTALVHDRLSILQWETLAASISNNINNMPLALGNSKSNLDSLDILTPNRLRLGRNNDRSPEGPLTISHRDKIIEENSKIFDSWFEVWLSIHVPRLLEQPKWFRSDVDLKPGDIVLFLKNESELSSNYQYGMVEDFETSRDGKIRKVRVRYRNASENVDRTTYRAVRSLVVIRRTDESNVMEELGEISRLVEASRQ